MRDSALAPSPPSPSSPGPVVPQGPSPQELQARREALAKRLLGGQSVRPAAPTTPPVALPNPLRYSNSGDAVDALKRRYEERVESATLAQSRKYILAAEVAMSKNDLVAAASALHIATRFSPEDAALAMRYQEVKNDADKLLCDSYIKQATYEQRAQHWPEAARTWQKVAKIRVGDVNANAMAARCLLKAENGDMHQAAEHAKLAASAEPAIAEHHATLAEIYARAGLGASARRAAETGLALEPKNPALLAVMKKMAKT